MEEQWIADRAALRALLLLHSDWPQSRLAEQLHRSVSWVKKWRRRLRTTPADDLASDARPACVTVRPRP